MHSFFKAPFLLAALASARSFTIDVTEDQVKLQRQDSHTTVSCYWSGTAPFCNGQCDTSKGEVQCNRNGCGDTSCCFTGWKVYCCQDYCRSSVETVPGILGGNDAHTRGDEAHDDYCDKGYIIVCPPGAKENKECRCIKDPGDGHHQSAGEEM